MKKLALFLLLSLLAAPVRLAAQRIKGSDTVLPLSQALAEMFMQSRPQATVTVTGGGSGVGISALMDGTTDLAMASRRIKFGEKMKMKQSHHTPCEFVVAYDALAVIVHPSNPVKRLTREQLEGIFRGKITNWKQVGGQDAKIIVYSRETSSGTYEFFKESVLNNKNYMSGVLSYLNPMVKALAVSYDGGRHYVAPSVKSAMSGRYPVVRPLYYYYDKANEARVRPFLRFINSKVARAKTLDLGFIPR